MNWWQAVVLGIVEGLTEYLPVSSTGHVLLTQRLLGIAESEAANAFAIRIQAGAIIAVLGIFRNRVRESFSGLSGTLAFGTAACERVLRLLLDSIIAFLTSDGAGSSCSNDWIDAHLLASAGGNCGLVCGRLGHFDCRSLDDCIPWRPAANV